MCSDSVYFNYFNKYIHCSVQNGMFCLFLTFLADFNEFRQVDLRMGSIYYFQFSGGITP